MHKTLLFYFLIFSASVSFAQRKLELLPNGFAEIEVPRPDKPSEKLIEASKGWGDYYNKKGNDVYDLQPNSLAIDALKENAFYIRNVGNVTQYRIKYTLKVEFLDKIVRLRFSVKEIYSNKTLTKMTVSDFFTPDGNLKEDYEEAKPSLELTANKIVNSYIDYVDKY